LPSRGYDHFTENVDIMLSVKMSTVNNVISTATVASVNEPPLAKPWPTRPKVGGSQF
jgi:hypothetical protein